MDSLKKLFSLCFRILIRLFFYAAVFVLLVWLLLGLTPTQTIQTSKMNIINLIYSTKMFTRDISKTAGNMGNVARHHLNEASERIDGKDPYENFNSSLDANIRAGNPL